eukprot:gene10071-3139_t
MTEKVKLLILGPPACGKSNISNVLAGYEPRSEYRETAGARVVQFDCENLNVGRRVTANVELWDVSGNLSFQSCWPAIYKDASGIIFVFDGNVQDQQKVLEFWWVNFANNTGVDPSCCTIFCHTSEPAAQSKGIPPMLKFDVSTATPPPAVNNIDRVYTVELVKHDVWWLQFTVKRVTKEQQQPKKVSVEYPSQAGKTIFTTA